MKPVWILVGLGVVGAAAAAVGAVYPRYSISSLYLTSAAKSAVSKLMRDPDSTKFENVAVNDKGIVCGMLNTRNGFGAYIGMRAFYYDPATNEANVINDYPPSDGFDRMKALVLKFEEMGCSSGPGHQEMLKNYQIIDSLEGRSQSTVIFLNSLDGGQ